MQEIVFRSAKKPSVVLFLEQTLVDMERFCTMKAPQKYFSPVPADTTYQIAGHYFTQTAFENLAVLRRDNLKSPWFPGISMFHRHQETQDFTYLWQVAKRNKPSLSALRVLGTDDDKSIYNAILGECDSCSSHLLGYEHFKKNIAFSSESNKNYNERYIRRAL